MSFILYNNKLKANFSAGEWVVVVGTNGALDRYSLFLYESIAGKDRSDLPSHLSLVRAGIQFPVATQFFRIETFSLWCFSGDKYWSEGVGMKVSCALCVVMSTSPAMCVHPPKEECCNVLLRHHSTLP